MKQFGNYVIALSLCLIFVTQLGCSRRLPKAYGVYVDTGFSYRELSAFKPQLQKSELNSRCFATHLVVAFPEDIMPVAVDRARAVLVFARELRSGLVGSDALRVTRLCYRRRKVESICPGIEGTVRTRRPGWYACEAVNFKVEPVKGEPDMILLVFERPLSKGLYAIHGKELDLSRAVGEAAVVAVGDAKAIKAAEETELDKQEKASFDSAVAVVRELNDAFNRQKFDVINEVWRSSSRGSDRRDLEEMRTWREVAGKVVQFEPERHFDVSEDLSQVTFRAEVVYEKGQRRTELYEVHKVGNRWYVVRIQAWNLE